MHRNVTYNCRVLFLNKWVACFYILCNVCAYIHLVYVICILGQFSVCVLSVSPLATHTVVGMTSLHHHVPAVCYSLALLQNMWSLSFFAQLSCCFNSI